MIRKSILGGLAAVMLLLIPPAAHAQPLINILTGGTSGIYFPLGVAIARIFTNEIPDHITQVQVTKASADNLMLLQNGEGTIAFTLGDTLSAARDGDDDAGFTIKHDKLRMIGAIYPSYIQIVATAGSGIKTLNDLKGKSLSVGAAKSGTELNARDILRAAGLSAKDLGRIEKLSFGESAELMKTGKLDATLQTAGLGVASLRDLAAASEVRLVPVPKDVIQKMGPPFMAATIPLKTYTGQADDISTAGVINYLVTSAEISDDLVYRMTHLIFGSLPALAQAHSAGRDIRLENAAAAGPVPLHPGAARYYRENGLIK